MQPSAQMSKQEVRGSRLAWSFEQAHRFEHCRRFVTDHRVTNPRVRAGVWPVWSYRVRNLRTRTSRTRHNQPNILNNHIHRTREPRRPTHHPTLAPTPRRSDATTPPLPCPSTDPTPPPGRVGSWLRQQRRPPPGSMRRRAPRAQPKRPDRPDGASQPPRRQGTLGSRSRRSRPGGGGAAPDGVAVGSSTQRNGGVIDLTAETVNHPHRHQQTPAQPHTAARRADRPRTPDTASTPVFDRSRSGAPPLPPTRTTHRPSTGSSPHHG